MRKLPLFLIMRSWLNSLATNLLMQFKQRPTLAMQRYQLEVGLCVDIPVLLFCMSNT